MNNYGQYAAFLEKRKALAGMLDKSSEVIQNLNMNQFGENLKQLSGKVDNDTFKIQVVGTFKNGKSTFINSLLGEYVLPAYSVPCTAVINEVKYGEEKYAKLYFRNPLPEHLPASIPEKARNHMEKHGMKDVPPMEISYEEIEDYVVIPMDADVTEMLLESPYEKVELFWPLPILKNGVEIIDSPGLNEAETRTKVTMDYLTKADAILFVLNATQACSAEEIKFIQNNLKGLGFEDPFFVVNRWDCIPEREKPRMEKFVKMKIEQYSTNPIFFVSSLMALEAKEAKDAQKYKDSGVDLLEARLTEFLTRQKGKAKLTQPAKELKRILTEETLYKIIPQQRQLLSSSLNDVKARYEAAKPRLTMLQTEKDQLINRLMLRIEQSKTEFKRVILRNTTTIIDSIPVWVEECRPKQEFGMIPKEDKANAIAAEISEYVKEKVEEHQQKWQKEVFLPVVQERASFIFDAASTDLERLYAEIDEVNVEIAGRQVGQVETVPTWQRVAGLAGGLLIGDVGMAFSAGVNGFSKELAKTAAFEVGAGAILAMLGLFNPVTLIAVLVSGGLWNWSKAKDNALKKLKTQLSQSMVNQVSETSDDSATQQVEKIAKKLSEAANAISIAVDVEIKETENQVQAIIAEMEKGQENVARREALINETEDTIKDLNIKLDQLIFRLVEE